MRARVEVSCARPRARVRDAAYVDRFATPERLNFAAYAILGNLSDARVRLTSRRLHWGGEIDVPDRTKEWNGATEQVAASEALLALKFAALNLDLDYESPPTGVRLRVIA